MALPQAHRLAAAALLGVTLSLSSCNMVGRFVEYTGGLRTSEEHTVYVRSVAQVGGFVGLLAGVPIDLVALPVTYPGYLVHSTIDAEDADLVSTLLLPSFALQEICSLIGAPMDVAEFLLYRAWLPPSSPTGPEQEEFELKLDHDTLPRYPVVPIYPSATK